MERWRIRHAMLRDVAYASLPKRERVRLHQMIAEPLRRSGHPSWAAEHLELAALASLDLDPDGPDRRRAGCRRPAARRRPGPTADGEPLRGRPLPAGARPLRTRATGGACARRGRSPAWARRTTGSASTRPRPRRSTGRWTSARSSTTRSRWRSRCGSSATSRSTSTPTSSSGGAAGPLARGRGGARRALGDRPDAAVRRMGPVDARRLRGGRAIWRRALEVAEPDDDWARVRALTSLSINLTAAPATTGRPAASRGGTRAERGGQRDRGGGGRPVQHRGHGRAAGPRARRPRTGPEESLPCLDRAIAIFEELGARWEFADAHGRARHHPARARPPRRGRGGPAPGDPHLRGARRAAARELDVARARSVSERRGDHAEAERQARRSRDAQEQFLRSHDD